jgi:hypothetical protein
MPDHLYRFRSTDALLDGHQELEAQQIYFCPPDQLNDPLEGFKDIFWRGDHVVWRNLLRHYLLNLMQATSISMILGQEFTPDICATLVHQTEDDLPQAPIRNIYATACREFFEHPASEHLITALSSQARAVRRDELIFYLRLIHPLAISRVLAALEQRGLVRTQSMTTLENMIKGMSQELEEVLRVHAQAAEMSDVLFSANENILSQLTLIHEFNNPVAEDRQSWLFITRDFPSHYVTALERLLYPDWHVACFVANPANASMWGAYADSHRGVCLKFKTRADRQEVPALDLYRAKSWSGGKDGVVAKYAYVPHYFEEVRYTAEFPEVDFFESLGTLPRYKLDGFWFAGQNGERSTTALRMLREEETWRQEYWRKFVASFSTKSPEWGHEKEHRLILYSSLERFDDLKSRKLKYRFADLAGIIFGIKTTTEDKLRIMGIIERKCVAEDRQGFEFYQAHYSNLTKRIELAPLTLLKMK